MPLEINTDPNKTYYLRSGKTGKMTWNILPPGKTQEFFKFG
jgi:hypothetical protein